MELMWLVCLGVGMILGIFVNQSINEYKNLSLDEYTHCVQIVANDMEQTRDGLQALLNEIQEYATNQDTELGHLSRDAQDIINRVKAMWDDK